MFSPDRPRWWQALHKMGQVVTLAGAFFVAGGAQAEGFLPGSAGLASVALGQLPAEARAAHRLIVAGGPFAHRKDGAVFGNRERVLPARPRGFYHEYTVNTPGSLDRGARRIVCGGALPARPDACFYTADHYTTFHRIVP